ncbi:hypothetical protein CYY_003383 [Polysphondylium violaceum]|uniref:FNIP repeat-containing protein n=1 Tax=Polysphondylium violaceum TaxID=133409 RepID=A0A8J4PX29_9MYCE|nr:hypothetical protein CYY_003383 [Polysphondylium violaceum]
MDSQWPYLVPSSNKSHESNTLFAQWNFRKQLMRLVIYEKDLVHFSGDNIPKEINSLQFKLFEPVNSGESKQSSTIKNNNKTTLLLSAIINIPPHIKSLEFLGSDDPLIDYQYVVTVFEMGVIPNSITHLTIFINKFYLLDLSKFTLPASVNHIGLSSWDNWKAVQKFIPASVTSLKVFKGVLERSIVLNPSITDLKLERAESYDHLVANIQTFRIMRKDYSTLPLTPEKRVYYRNDTGYQSGAELPSYGGVFKVMTFPSVPIPSSTTKLIWKSFRAPSSIPLSVKSITFGHIFNEPIPKDLLPESVESVIFQGANQCLSRINLPSTLKHLDLGPEFKQFLFGNEHIPPSVTFLEIYLEDDDIYQFLFSKFTIPRSVTHLKIHFVKNFSYSCYFPSSIKYISCDSHFYSKIFVVDAEEYYNRAMERHPGYSVKSILKSIKLSKDFSQTILRDTLPSSLTMLQCSNNYKKTVDLGALPRSINKLVCPRPPNLATSGFAPDHQLDYLQYYLDLSTVDITIKGPIKITDTIPITYSVETGLFPQPSIPIDQLTLLIYNDGTLAPLNSIIRKLIINKQTIPPQSIPESVKELVLLSCRLQPGSIPASVEELEIRSESAITQDLIPMSVRKLKFYSIVDHPLAIIPPSVVELTANINYNTLSLLSSNDTSYPTPVYDKPQPIHHNNTTMMSKDPFLRIWRNTFLKQKILDYYYISRVFISTLDECKLAQQLFKQQCLVCPKEKDLYQEILDTTDCSSFVDLDARQINYSIDSYPKSLTSLSLGNFNPTSPIPWRVTHLSGSRKDDICPPTVQSLTAQYPSRTTDLSIPPNVSHLTIGFYHVSFSGPLSVKSLRLESKATFSVLEKVTCPLERISISYQVFQRLRTNVQLPLSIVGGPYDIYDTSKQISTSATTLIWPLNLVVPEGLIPGNINRIIFGNEFNQIITENSLPSTITHINFGNSFNQNLDFVFLPPRLRYLSFGESFDQSIENLPQTLLHLSLYLGSCFNIMHIPPLISHLSLYSSKRRTQEKVPIFIPKFVKHLSAYVSNIYVCSTTIKSIYSNQWTVNILDPDQFDLKYKEYTSSKTNIVKEQQQQQQQLSKSMVIHLNNTLGKFNFNQFIRPNFFSSDFNIKSIDFGDSFNQIILEKTIPMSVEIIKFGKTFNQKLGQNCLPNSVTKISLGFSFNQPLFLPPSVTFLSLGDEFNQPLHGAMLPDVLEELYFGRDFNQPIDHIAFPASLKILHFGNEFNQIFAQNNLPSGIKELSIGENFLNPLDILINTQLTCLILKSGYYSVLDQLEWIPNTVTKLSLGGQSTFSLILSAELIPRSVTDLSISDYQPMIDLDFLSPNVSILKIGKTFKGRIPPTVQHLELSDYFDLPLEYILPINR